MQRDSKKDTKPLLQQYQKLQRRKRDLVDDYASGLLTRIELAQAKATVERQIEQVQAELSRLQPQHAIGLIPAGQTMREAWANGSLQSLAEWSDSHAAGEALAAQGIDRGRICHLVRRSSVAWCQTLLSLLIERVVIKPTGQTYALYHGYRFSPESVEIRWKS